MTIQTETYELPSHWASALINGDLSGYDDSDIEALEAFEADMVKRYGQCWCLDVADCDSGNFRRYHDATCYGVLACDVATYTFDVTPR